MRKLVLLFGLVGMVFGQAPQTINLSAPSPPPVGVVSLQRVGNQGNTTYYYWIVANFPIGAGGIARSEISNSPDTLSATNYIKILWSPVLNATSYDILRTTTNNFTSTCNCAVATGVTATTYNDQGAALVPYSYSGTPLASASITLDNQNQIVPNIVINAPTNITTVANLPNAVNSKFLERLIIDGANATDCTIGGGASLVKCASDGAIWVSLSAAGGGSGTVTNTGVLTLNAPVVGNGLTDVKIGTKTGTGTEFVASQSPTIVTPTLTSPTIADLTNAQHDHSAANKGGNISSTAVAAGNKQGDGTKFQMYAGAAPSNNDCAKFDATGNVTSTGSPCSTSVGTVTNTGALTSDLPIVGNAGVDIKVGAKVGTGTTFQMAGAGVPALDDCAKFDANGNIITAGAPCGSGGGSPAGVAGDIQYNNSGVFGARTPQGTGTKVQMSTGTAGANKQIAIYDANGNVVDNGYTCQIDPTNGLTCGDGTKSEGVIFKELAVNGTNFFGQYGGDNRTADACIRWPNAAPTDGQALTATAATEVMTDGNTCVVMDWVTPGGGGVSSGATLPATCTVGEVYALTAQYTTATLNYYKGLYTCTTTNIWTAGADRTGVNSGLFFGRDFIVNGVATLVTNVAIWYQRVVIPDTITARQWATWTANADAGQTIGVAIYDASDNRLTTANTTGMDCTTVGRTVVNFDTPITLSPGIYYIAIASNSGVTGVFSIGTEIYTSSLIGNSTMTYPAMFVGANTASFAGTTITWPATIGVKTGDNGNHAPYWIGIGNYQ